MEELPSGENWDIDFLQISRGPLNYRLDIYDLGDVAIEFPRCKAALHVADVHTAPYVTFGFVIDGSSDPLLLGRPIEKGEAIVWQPCDPFRYEFVTPDSMAGLIVRVAEDVTIRRGWAAKLQRLLKPSESGLRNLLALCRDVASGVVPPTPSTADVVVECLEVAFGRHLFVGSETSLFQQDHAAMSVLDHARTFLSWIGSEEIENVDEVSALMGLSRRSLYRAFRQWPGVGPAKYSRMLRLAEVRKRLLEHRPGDTFVTSIAQEYGFGHSSRFAAEYQNFFGEKPSETLRRNT